MIRRLGIPFVGLVLLVGAVITAPTSDAAPVPRYDEEAMAFWSFPTGRPHRTIEYGAGIYRHRDAATGEVLMEFAGFFKARCKTEKTEKFTMVTCRGFSGERATDFYFDPTLQTAWVESKKSRIEWVGQPELGMYFMEEMCGWWNEEGEPQEGSGRGVGRAAPAKASGNIGSTDLKAGSGKRPFGGLQVGVAVTECPFLGRDQMADIFAGGPFSYSRRISD